MPYLNARAIMDRLDEVAGVDGWTDTYEVLGILKVQSMNNGKEALKDRVSVKCTLTINGISKEDAGQGDDLKAACRDALKRAAVRFGIGRYLYSTESVWSPLDEGGRIQNVESIKHAMLGGSSPRQRATLSADISPNGPRTVGDGSSTAHPPGPRPNHPNRFRGGMRK